MKGVLRVLPQEMKLVTNKLPYRSLMSRKKKGYEVRHPCCVDQITIRRKYSQPIRQKYSQPQLTFVTRG